MARIEEKKWGKRGGETLTEKMIVRRIPPQNLKAGQNGFGGLAFGKSGIF